MNLLLAGFQSLFLDTILYKSEREFLQSELDQINLLETKKEYYHHFGAIHLLRFFLFLITKESSLDINEIQKLLDNQPSSQEINNQLNSTQTISAISAIKEVKEVKEDKIEQNIEPKVEEKINNEMKTITVDVIEAKENDNEDNNNNDNNNHHTTTTTTTTTTNVLDRWSKWGFVNGKKKNDDKSNENENEGNTNNENKVKNKNSSQEEINNNSNTTNNNNNAINDIEESTDSYEELYKCVEKAINMLGSGELFSLFFK